MRGAFLNHLGHSIVTVFPANGVRWILISCLSLGLANPVVSEGISLEQAIREVCTMSDSVKMMQETLKKSKEMVREKWSNALPVLSASAYGLRNRGSLFGGGGGTSARQMSVPSDRGVVAAMDQPLSFIPTDTTPVTKSELNSILQSMFSNFSEPQCSNVFGGSVSFSQPLYTFGKIGTAIDVANKFDKSTRYSNSRNRQTLQLTALDAFFRTILTNKAAEVTERSLNRKKEMNEFLERNFELGSGNKAQVLSTKADVLNQSSLAMDAKRNAYITRMHLNMFMGRPLTDAEPLDTGALPEGLLGVQRNDPEKNIAIALEDRQDLKSLKSMSDATKGGAKIFRAMYYPSIAATGSLGYSKFESGSTLMENDGMMNWSAGVGAQWTLFDGFAYSAKAAQLRSDARKLDLAYESITKAIAIDIRSDLAECNAADSNYAASKEMLNAAKEGYDLTFSNFKQGSGQLADLLHVDEQLQQAEFGLMSAWYRFVRSRAALRVAMGQNIVKVEE